MRDEPINPQDFVEAQSLVFRLAKRDCKLSIARLHALTKIPEATLATWGKGTSMPAWAMVELSKHIPANLMNLLLEPAGVCFAPVEHSDSDLDTLACEASGFTHELLEAKRDGKVTHIEKARLKETARRVAAAAASIA